MKKCSTFTQKLFRFALERLCCQLVMTKGHLTLMKSLPVPTKAHLAVTKTHLAATEAGRTQCMAVPAR